MRGGNAGGSSGGRGRRQRALSPQPMWRKMSVTQCGGNARDFNELPVHRDARAVSAISRGRHDHPNSDSVLKFTNLQSSPPFFAFWHLFASFGVLGKLSITLYLRPSAFLSARVSHSIIHVLISHRPFPAKLLL